MKKLTITANRRIVLTFIIGLFLFSSCVQKEINIRTKLSLDDNWQFTLNEDADIATIHSGNVQWENVHLPHDWSIEQGFDKNNPSGRRGGYFPGGVGWYKKSFKIPNEQKDKRVILEFDGVYKDADIWLNNQHVGFHKHGYISFHYDVSDFIKKDTVNQLILRLDNTDLPHDRWYSGCGIYRHVWINYVSDVHIPIWGTYITTPGVSKSEATVALQTEVTNTSKEEAECRVETQIYSPNGLLVQESVTQPELIPAGKRLKFVNELHIDQPELWSMETPVLYTAMQTVTQNGKVVDKVETTFGIREIKFSVDNGFQLNGKRIFLNGINMHHDGGSVGSAVPEWTWYTRLKTLKEMGVNAIRTSHNPHAPEILDMCDTMGILVIDEAFDKWEITEFHGAGWSVTIPSFNFKDNWKFYLQSFIERDRNHPSVILWSVGNEVVEADRPLGTQIMKRLADFIHEFEPTRKVTAAIQPVGHKPDGAPWDMAFEMDVVSYNYQSQYYQTDKEKYGFIIIGSETLPYYTRNYQDPDIKYVEEVSWFPAKKHALGHFIWTGIDYLGEAVQPWPLKGWENAPVNTAGFRKSFSWYIESLYSDKPMVHIAVRDETVTRQVGKAGWDWPPVSSHWNWSKSGKPLKIFTYSNCESVELILNGKSIGEKLMRNYPEKLMIWEVPFNEGQIEAIGKNNGKEVSRHVLRTAGEPLKIKLSADRKKLNAANRDAVHLTAELYDENDVLFQLDDKNITFSVSGPAKIIGVDNGDLWSLESYKGNQRETRNGKCLAILQTTGDPGEITVKAEGAGVRSSEIKIEVQ